jgi:mono/diheme cytochrome c family protein
MQIDPNRLPQQDAPRMTVGELLWQHGRGGRQVQLSFASAQWQSQIDDAAIARTIAGGKPPDMPAFADLLTPKQITALVTHIRALGPRSN